MMSITLGTRLSIISAWIDSMVTVATNAMGTMA